MIDYFEELPTQLSEVITEVHEPAEVVEALWELTAELSLMNETMMFFQSWLVLATVGIVVFLLYKLLWSLFGKW